MLRVEEEEEEERIWGRDEVGVGGGDGEFEAWFLLQQLHADGDAITTMVIDSVT